jgi:FtsP/CotA-like multicopper oxidase with cupredoxin domain
MTKGRFGKKTKLFVVVVVGAVALLIGLATFGVLAAKPPAGPVQLGGNKIPQFVDPLPTLHVITDDGSQIELQMREFQSQVMPSTWAAKNPAYTGTYVWGYLQQGQVVDPTTSYIGPVIVATRDNPTEIKYVNMLGTTQSSNLGFWKTSIDQSLHWADPAQLGEIPGNTLLYTGPIPAVPHLHGGEVPPELDGGPDAWFYDPNLLPTDYLSEGHAYYTRGNLPNTDGSATYRYPNTQEAGPLWFHDHLLGATRLNVYAGLAGAYLLTDPVNDPANLPPLVPLVIQDRMFDTAGQLLFPNVGINPEHPYWIPEFVGDTIVVNGKVWPFKAVDRQRYSFLFLNGSNARAYDMFLQDQTTGIKGPSMWVIGTDGGYLDTPAKIDPNVPKKAGQQSLVMMPGERYTVIVDFNDPVWLNSIKAAYGGAVPNTLNLTLRNTARTPYPAGAAAVPSTTGRIMQFRVNMLSAITDNSYNPDPAQVGGGALRPSPMQRLVNPLTGALNVTPDKTRSLTLNEVMGAGGPLAVLVNNALWDGLQPDGNIRPDYTPVLSNGETYYYSELPQEGQTEIWEIINLTADAHPIHLHLVQFQLQSRQALNVLGYNAVYNAAFPGGGIGPYPPGVYMPGYGPPKPYDFYATGANIPPRGPIFGGNPDVSPYLLGVPMPPLPSEAGWKDTVIMYPGEVTRIAVRWAPTDLPIVTAAADAYFPFDPDGGHGYVWHCHIIDHEDNEMMRPTSVVSNTGPSVARTYLYGVDY